MPTSKKKKPSAKKKKVIAKAKKSVTKKIAPKKTVEKKPLKSSMPAVGTKAPAFRAHSTSGELVDSSSFLGRGIVLYFYPKDDTPGCTVEACSFRDHHPEILSTGTVVIGVSGDSIESHQRFTTKYKLPFPLLADSEHKVAMDYGVWVEKNNYGKKYMGIQRATFLINKEGKVAAVWPKVKVEGHTAEVIEAISSLL
jgi:peroxiredoxin Q/BCP